MPSPPSIARNVFSNWGGLAVNIALSFILSPIVVRSLGDTWYGVWGITMQFTGYLWLLDLGIRESVVRYVAKHSASRDQQTVNAKVSIAVYLYVLISLLTLAIGVIASRWMPALINIDASLVPVAKTVVLLTAVNMSLAWMANPFVGILIGLQRYDLMNMAGLSISVARFIGTVLFMRSGHGIVALSLLHIAATCASGALVYALSMRLMPSFRVLGIRSCRGEFREVWTFSAYVVVNNLASKIILATDGFIIASHLPVAAVTYFSIPTSLLQHLTSGMRSMTQVLYPRTSSLDGARDSQGLGTLFLMGSKYSALIGLSVASVLLTIGADFIRLWMGPAYAEHGGPVLATLTIAYMLTFPHYAVYYVLLGLGRQRSMTLLKVAEALVNLTLSLILVRRLGILGVALGTAIPHVVSMMIVLPFLACIQVGVPVRDYYRTAVLRPLLSATPAVMLGYFFHRSFPAENIGEFIAQTSALVLVFVSVAWLISLTNMERALLMERARAMRSSQTAT